MCNIHHLSHYYQKNKRQDNKYNIAVGNELCTPYSASL
jgi:hypothetical protein